MSAAEICRVIWRLFQINVAMTFAYRFEFVLYMISSITTPVVGLAIWRATANNGADLPVSAAYLTTYFVLSSPFSVFTSAWHADWIPSMIRTGKLSVWLARPGSAWFEVIANNLAEKVIKFLILVPMVGALAWAYREDMAIPGDPLRWAGACISLVLGAVMFFSFRACLGIIGFWWEETRSILLATYLLESILVGGIIPLALFPEWAQGFLSAQIFRFRFAFPLEVLLADLSAAELVWGYAWQVAWTLATLFGAMWLWRQGRQAYIAVGG